MVISTEPRHEQQHKCRKPNDSNKPSGRNDAFKDSIT